MQTYETVERALNYIERMRGMGRHADMVSLSLRTNGYDYGDKRQHTEYLHAVRTVNAVDIPTIVVWHESTMRDAVQSHYLIDDGRTVTPHYVAGWGPKDSPTAMHLNPFPVNYHADGTPIMRADRSEPVDYSGWMLEPRRAYHVKLTEYTPEQLQAILRKHSRT